MKSKLQNTYRCGYCNKLYLRKSACEKHELSCGKNPLNHRPCFLCENMAMVNATYVYDDYRGENSRQVSVLYCSAKKEFIYPPKVEGKRTAFDYLVLFEHQGELPNNPMPKQCDIFDKWMKELNEIGHSINPLT